MALIIPGSGITYGLPFDGLFEKNSRYLPDEALPSNPHDTAPREALAAVDAELFTSSIADCVSVDTIPLGPADPSQMGVLFASNGVLTATCDI